MAKHPATFHGKMFVKDSSTTGSLPRFGAEGATLRGLDQFGATFEFEIAMTLDRLLALGCTPVAASHPDHRLYLAAKADHDAGLTPADEPLLFPDLKAPGVMSVPFETEFDLAPEAWHRLGLRSPHEQAEAARAAEAARRAPPPRPTPAASAARSFGGSGVPLPPPRPGDRSPRQQAADKAALQSIAAGWRDRAQARAELGRTMAFAGKPYGAPSLLPPTVEDEFDDENFEHFEAAGLHHAARRLPALDRAIGAAELVAGLGVTEVGADMVAAGLATSPAGVGVPLAAGGAVTVLHGAAMTTDGYRRFRHGDEGFTAHPEPRPTPPAPPLVVPPIEGFDPHPVAEKPKVLATPLPTPALPVQEGLVPPQPIGPMVLSIYGDGQPDMIHTPKQDRHTPGLQTDAGRSTLTHPDPQQLLDAHTGRGAPTRTGMTRGKEGFKETFDAGVEVGVYRNNRTGRVATTTRGTIHYSKRGAHIVPAPPEAPSEPQQGQTAP